ncbi:MAG: 1-deoxy-D-xylulose-5-phosphate reductoisomerase [Thermodesulfovibrionales bacterium]
MKNIVILGSTGSIGKTTLEVIEKAPDRFRILGLAARSNLYLLLKQINRYLPEIVAVYDEDAAEILKKKVNIKVLSGINGLIEIAVHEKADFVLSAIVGAAGLLPTLAAIKRGKTIGLANKETLVIAGRIVTEEAKRSAVKIIPVDSEHSAVFQCLEKRNPFEIKRIILTASGGPFRGRSKKELRHVKVKEALRHPNWRMGAKITVDSATLMNKGLEVIEARWLFDIPPERIDVVIHPESIIHSMVEFSDGTIIAQLSRPDMKAPIAYALSYPERLSDIVEPLDFETLRTLTFEKPDRESFPCLDLAYSAIKDGGTMPAVLNAANEIAVDAFLKERIGFTDIPSIIERVIEKHQKMPCDTIEEVLEADAWARQEAERQIRRIA